ncbi:hypothetical protein HNY73_013717 [Argiope bruennichi]|uniref:Uncharacterized protein n=1 Tax=Argiope bruennichi TaxID=94029 RepID=A0A8T0EN14_ARGBR|nr:hypothetical protein HNY73_013717 [Argiope bruennichi]
MAQNLSLRILMFCIFALLFPESSSQNQRRERNDDQRSNGTPPPTTQHPCSAENIQCGVPQKFCNMFGCDCTPKPGARCCDGYRYDKTSNKCRQIVVETNF